MRYFTDDIRLSPQSTDIDKARECLTGDSDGLDGVMAKQLDQPYRTGERAGIAKVKRLRTADCVVGGFRYASAQCTFTQIPTEGRSTRALLG